MSALICHKPATTSINLMFKPSTLLYQNHEYKENFHPSPDSGSDAFDWEDSRKLTAQLGEKCYEHQSDVLELNRNLPKAQGIVGDLPAEWRLKLRPDVSMAASRNTIFTAFKQTAAKIREACHFTIKPLRGVHFLLRQPPAGYEGNTDPDISAEALTQALKETGVTRQTEPITFQFLDEGGFGTIHKFQVDDKTYVLKLFKGGTNPMENFADFHGSPIEQQRAVFIQQNAPNAPFNKFYFGDIDANGAYMVTDFVDSGTTDKRPAERIDLSPWGLEYGDPLPVGNIRQGRIVDYGGIVPLKPPPSSKPQQAPEPAGDGVG